MKKIKIILVSALISEIVGLIFRHSECHWLVCVLISLSILFTILHDREAKEHNKLLDKFNRYTR